MKLINTSMMAAVLLSGCNLIEIKKINTEVEKNASEFKQLADTVQQGKTVDARKPAPVNHVGGLWLPSKRLSSEEGKTRANPALTRKITVNRSFFNIEDMAERITILTGIPVIIAPEAAGSNGGSRTMGGGMGGGMSGGMAGGGTGGGLPIVPALGGGGAGGAAGGSAMPGMAAGGVNLVYNGTLTGFLDVAAARYSVFWEWQDNAIRFYRVKSRTFRLAALPGDTTLNATVTAQTAQSSGGGSGSSGGGSGGSGGSTNQQESGVSFSGLSVWKGIEESVKTMLTSMGKVVVTPSTGTISVTDTPIVLAQVEKLINQQNLALSRQVAINVRVLAVELENTDQLGINWEAVYENLASGSKIGFEGAGSVTKIASGMGLTLAGTSTGNNHTNSANALISALSTQGRVSQVTSASLTTLNNQPAPLQIGKQTSYLASSSVSAIGTGVGTAVPLVTLQPGVVTTGFSMNLVPHIMDDERLLLQYAINLSELKNNADGTMKTFGTGVNQIQTPEVNTRNFLQRVVLNSGDMMAVAGFEQSGMSGIMEGVGKPENLALGGKHSNNKGKVIVVVLLQPVLAN